MIHLEKTTPKLRLRDVLNFLKRLLHRPALRLGNLGLRTRSQSQLRNERFASYLAANNRKSINTDLHDTLLASRKLARHVTVLAVLGLLVWVVVESAQAIGVF